MAWRKFSKSRKAYRKKYRVRRRGARMFGGGIMSRVKRMLASRAETKVIKNQYTITLTNDRVFSSQPLGTILRGTGQNERIGESIRLVGMKIVYAFEPLSSRWSGQTRTRLMIVRGQAWAATSALFATLAAAVEDQVFDKAAPRNGAEVWNTDMGALLRNQETVWPQKVISTAAAQTGGPLPTQVNQIDSIETTDSSIRKKLWFPAKGSLVKWRNAAEQYTFTTSQPNLVFYAYNPSGAYAAALGTVYMTIHIYYKDM